MDKSRLPIVSFRIGPLSLATFLNRIFLGRAHPRPGPELMMLRYYSVVVVCAVSD
jgi:hypothetical protein